MIATARGPPRPRVAPLLKCAKALDATEPRPAAAPRSRRSATPRDGALGKVPPPRFAQVALPPFGPSRRPAPRIRRSERCYRRARARSPPDPQARPPRPGARVARAKSRRLVGGPGARSVRGWRHGRADPTTRRKSHGSTAACSADGARERSFRPVPGRRVRSPGVAGRPRASGGSPRGAPEHIRPESPENWGLRSPVPLGPTEEGRFVWGGEAHYHASHRLARDRHRLGGMPGGSRSALWGRLPGVEHGHLPVPCGRRHRRRALPARRGGARRRGRRQRELRA